MRYKLCKKILAAIVILSCVIGKNPVSIKADTVDHGSTIHISQAKGNPSVVLGSDAKVSQLDNRNYQYLSIDLTQGDDFEEVFLAAQSSQVKGIQINIVVEEAIDTLYWKKVGEISAKLEKIVWFNFITTNETLSEQVNQLTEVLKEETQETLLNSVHYIYTPTNMAQVEELINNGKTHLQINLEDMEDVRLLESIYKSYKDEVRVTVTDCIVHNSQLTEAEQIKLINTFYYELPLSYPNIERIYQTHNPNNYPTAIQNTYRRVLTQSWLSVEDYIEKGTAHTQVDYITPISDAPLQIFVLEEDKPIEYVDYKVNGGFIGRRSAYPYPIQIDLQSLYQGNNELRAIIKYQGDESLEVECSYLRRETTPQVQERSMRSTPTYALDQKMIYKTGYIPVLMYHMFKDVVPNTEYDQSISVSTKIFEQHIQRLNKEGYTPITFLDYENYLNGIGGLPEKPYIITADDGYLDNYTHAFPVLKQYNVPATFFITTQYVGIPTNFEHFTWEQAREMEESGLVDIQSHTNSHELLDTVDQATVDYQVNRSFGEIEAELGKRDVKVLAYPQFQHTDETQRWLAEFGIQLQMTNLMREGMASTRVDIKRIHVHNEMSSDELIKEIKRLTDQ